MVNTVSYPPLTWVNKDGLPVRFGKGNQVDAVVGKPTQFGVEQILEAEVVWDRLPAFSASENIGMIYGGYPNVSIPKGAFIKSCSIQPTTVEAAASSQTLSIGLVTNDGTEIDNDGLFDAVTQSTLSTTANTAGTGALIGTTLASEGYLWATVQTASFTTLVARVQVVYYMPPTDKNNT
jgi:hypothetical protein